MIEQVFESDFLNEQYSKGTIYRLDSKFDSVFFYSTYKLDPINAFNILWPDEIKEGTEEEKKALLTDIDTVLTQEGYRYQVTFIGSGYIKI